MTSRARRRTALRRLASLAVITAAAAVVPRAWCGREAGAWLRGDVAVQSALGDVVAARALRGIRPSDFSTGSEHFNGEWSLVTNQMTVLGLGQIVAQHPEARSRYVGAMRAAVRQMLEPGARAFGTREWRGEDGFASLDGDHGHAYLGYLGMALGMLRLTDPEMDRAWVDLHDRLSAALARRLSRAPYGMIETFPGVTFPADVASVVGAVGLHARASGADHRALLDAWVTTFRARYVHPASGYVYQTADPERGVPTGPARGSGTAISAYMLSFADVSLARDLHRAIARAGVSTLAGFGGVREYGPGERAEAGDVDSGPVVLGVSVSASGFALAAARMFRDEATFTPLFRTAYLFGVPVGASTGEGFLLGSGMGNAILLAMMTADVASAGPGR